MRRPHRVHFRRRAAAAVEMALVSPLLILILMGIMEFGWLFHVKQSLLTATRVGARTATLPGATNAEIQADVVGLLTDMGLTAEQYPYQLTITRATDEDPYETVELVMQYSDVTITGGFFNWLNIGTIRSVTSYRSEGDLP